MSGGAATRAAGGFSGVAAAEARGATRRLLKALAAGPGRLVGGGAAVLVAGKEGGEGERRLALPDGLAAALARAELIRIDAAGEVVATTAGIAWLRRSLAGGLDPFRAQQGAVAPAAIDLPGGGLGQVLRDRDESPLSRLAARRGRDGRPLLDAAQVAAGERLRADFTFAGLTQRVTMDWSAFGAAAGGGRGGGRGGAAELSEAALAARERLGRALAALGPELSGVALDVCCFLVGLEAVEAARGWPVRSAKVVLAIALGRLAEHYGLAAAASGPEAARGIRHWGGEDYRPRA